MKNRKEVTCPRSHLQRRQTRIQNQAVWAPLQKKKKKKN